MATAPDRPKIRLGILGVVAVGLFVALLARLWFIQVMTGPEYQEAAVRNQVRVVPLEPMRGRILDREGEVLADSRLSLVVTVERDAIRDPDDRAALFASLSPVLGAEPSELEARAGDGRYSPVRPLPLAEDVPIETAVFLRERPEQFAGVSVEEVFVRRYPFGRVASHVLGYVGPIDEAQLEAREGQGYEPGDTVGREGVEATFEDDLRGEPGRLVLEVDADGRVLRQLERVDPAPGDDVRLTVDVDVQALAEQLLRDEILLARQRSPRPGLPRFAAPGGSVVVTDPQSGGLLAMASYPDFDPNQFVGGISQRDYDVYRLPEANNPLVNRALSGQYHPGSTWKLITAIAALRHGLIDTRFTLNDPGFYRVPDCRGNCVFRNAGSVANGQVDVVRSLSVSSDVFYYHLGVEFDRLGAERREGIQETAAAFGFGQGTGVALPGEPAPPGRIPSRAVKEALHQANPTGFPDSDWYNGDALQLAIGQGLTTVTPLQLVGAYAAFANGGTLHAPNVALRVERRDGSVVRELGPRVLQQVDLRPEHRAPVLEGLRRAVVEGTGEFAFEGYPHDRFPVAGKTGTAQTAQNEDWKDTSLFAAFAPLDAPRYAVAAVLEEAGFGSSAAAPLSRVLLQALFEDRVPEALRVGEAPPRPQPDELTEILPDDRTGLSD